MKNQYSREDYLASRCTHRQYYAQFVTPGIRSMVASRFGQRLFTSRDPHFNDICLYEWDGLAQSIRAEDNSLCARVCTLKESARQLVDEGEKS